MKPPAALMFAAILLLCGKAAAMDQKPAPDTDRAAALEQARQTIESQLSQGSRKGITVTASDEKRIRRLTINVKPNSTNPRDDASTALSRAWQPALQFVKAFDEIAVQVGTDYVVTCGTRAFADTTISLWGEALARTCRERRR